MTRIHQADQFVGSLFEEVYRVGGSVRDEIIGRRPKDADYIVRGVGLDAMAYKLRDEGCKIAPIVARNKAVLGWRTSIPQTGLVEIVLPRTEQSAGRGRDMEIHVDPALSLAEDAKRRDFTFNALYKGVGPGYPESAIEGGVIDPTSNGLYDLQHRIVRVTHAVSFRDDPLRILRALRFISTLDADLSDETVALMTRFADEVTGLTDKGVSGTVFEEFGKLLMGQAPGKALRIARDTGVLAVAMPELAPILAHDPNSRYHDLSTDEHTFKALDTAAKVDAPARVRWALLFHDSGKPDAEWVGPDGRKHYYARDEDEYDHEIHSGARWMALGRRLNVPKALRHDVYTLIVNHMVPTKTRSTGVRVRRMRVAFGDELLHDLLLHRICDLYGKDVKVARNHIDHIAKMEALRSEAAAAGVPASVKDLVVNGHDAKKAGLDGRDIGNTLNALLDEVVCEPDERRLSREWQLARLEALA